MSLRWTCSRGLDRATFFKIIAGAPFAKKEDPGHRREKMQVIGAGLGRTGTDSLRTALDLVGYKTYHMTEAGKYGDSARLNEFLDGGGSDAALLDRILSRNGFNATVDFPMSLWFEQLLTVAPAARVILGVRDSPDAWARSLRATIGSAGGPRKTFRRAPWRFVPELRESSRLVDRIFEGIGLELEDDGSVTYDSAVAAYVSWIEKVVAAVPPDQLLIHNAKDGWPPLCAFLGIKESDCADLGAYPRVNSTPDMLWMFGVIETVADAFPYAAALAAAAILLALRRCLLSPRKGAKAD